MKPDALQWGGRFEGSPDAGLLRFGSSLEDDLVLAPFDLQCSLAHVTALEGGGIVDAPSARELRAALGEVGREIERGTFEKWARASGAEDIHGAIDARVREISERSGELLHAGRSRNDQVATTLVLYARDRARRGAATVRAIARELLAKAKEELAAGTTLAATTHWQPAQPVLLAFWLVAACEPFARSVRRFASAEAEATAVSPLGSGAVAGSTLPLDGGASASELGFAATSRNAMDAIGTRDAMLDVAHAVARAATDASRLASELVVWCTPAFGYARLGDASSTGSSLMPQKRNPDPYELVRAAAAESFGSYASAVDVLRGLPLSYHRDLQTCKRLGIRAIETGLAALRAFGSAIADTRFLREAMNARAGDGFTVATDVADALIRSGLSARRSHELVGAAVSRAEREGRTLEARDLVELASAAGVASVDVALDAPASVRAKRTPGSTHPDEVAKAIAALDEELA